MEMQRERLIDSSRYARSSRTQAHSLGYRQGCHPRPNLHLRRFSPDGLSKSIASFLDADEQRLLSQIQGRTYANMFGLVERFIAARSWK
jgi:hypothetical protein